MITDKRLRTRHTVHTESHWGSSIVIEQGMDYSYLIKVEQISNFDPQTPADCQTYDAEEFYQCSDEELQQIWKPLINCNPPWVSSNDHCIHDLNLTRKIAESVFDNSYVPVASIYEMVTYLKKDICIKASTYRQNTIDRILVDRILIDRILIDRTLLDRILIDRILIYRIFIDRLLID